MTFRYVDPDQTNKKRVKKRFQQERPPISLLKYQDHSYFELMAPYIGFEEKAMPPLSIYISPSLTGLIFQNHNGIELQLRVLITTMRSESNN